MLTCQPCGTESDLIGCADSNSAAPTPLVNGTCPGWRRPIDKITFPIVERKVSVTYDYVSYGGDSSRTRQRSTTAPGGLASIRRLPGGTVAAGDTFTPRSQPPTIVVDSITYKFAFQYVSGGTPTGQVPSAEVASFVAGGPPKSIIVGNGPIAVLVLYVPIAAEDPSNGFDSVGECSGDATSLLCSEALIPVGPEPWGFW